MILGGSRAGKLRKKGLKNQAALSRMILRDPPIQKKDENFIAPLPRIILGDGRCGIPFGWMGGGNQKTKEYVEIA